MSNSVFIGFVIALAVLFGGISAALACAAYLIQILIDLLVGR
jgi:hypothetical protein